MYRHPLLIGGLTAAILMTIANPVLPAEARYFAGYRCTDQCKGHAAGFQWARHHRIINPDDCVSGPSLSYLQGCRAYSRDRMRDGTKDDAGHSID